MKKAPLIVAGIIFALVAFIHLARLCTDFTLIIGNSPVPLWANGIGFIVTALLSGWMFCSAKN